MKSEKIFCKNCKYYLPSYYCKKTLHYTFTPYEKIKNYKSIYNINKNNDCKLYKKSLWFGSVI